jgi:hypothetical protein
MLALTHTHSPALSHTHAHAQTHACVRVHKQTVGGPLHIGYVQLIKIFSLALAAGTARLSESYSLRYSAARTGIRTLIWNLLTDPS